MTTIVQLFYLVRFKTTRISAIFVVSHITFAVVVLFVSYQSRVRF